MAYPVLGLLGVATLALLGAQGESEREEYGRKASGGSAEPPSPKPVYVFEEATPRGTQQVRTHRGLSGEWPNRVDTPHGHVYPYGDDVQAIVDIVDDPSGHFTQIVTIYHPSKAPGTYGAMAMSPRGSRLQTAARELEIWLQSNDIASPPMPGSGSSFYAYVIPGTREKVAKSYGPGALWIAERHGLGVVMLETHKRGTSEILLALSDDPASVHRFYGTPYQ